MEEQTTKIVKKARPRKSNLRRPSSIKLVHHDRILLLLYPARGLRVTARMYDVAVPNICEIRRAPRGGLRGGW